MAELARYAEKEGFQARGEWESLKRLEEVAKPVIAFVNQNHFVVVLQAKNGWVTFFDPAATASFRWMRSNEFRRAWSGEVLRILPSSITDSGGRTL